MTVFRKPLADVLRDAAMMDVLKSSFDKIAPDVSLAEILVNTAVAAETESVAAAFAGSVPLLAYDDMIRTTANSVAAGVQTDDVSLVPPPDAAEIDRLTAVVAQQAAELAKKNEAETALLETEQENATLRAASESRESILAALNARIAELEEEKKQTEASHASQVARLNAEAEEVRAQLVAKFKKELAQAQESINFAYDEKSDQESRADALEIALDDAKIQSAALLIAKEKLASKLQLTETENVELKAEVESLRTASLRSSSDTATQLAESEAEKARLTVELSKVTAELSVAVEASQRERGRADAASETDRQARAQVTALREETRRFAAERSVDAEKIEALTAAQRAATERIVALETEQETLIAAHRTEQAEAAKVASANLQKVLEQRDRDIAALNDKLQKTQSKIGERSGLVKKTDQLKKEVDRLKQELEKAQREVSTRDAQLAELNIQLAKEAEAELSASTLAGDKELIEAWNDQAETVFQSESGALRAIANSVNTSKIRGNLKSLGKVLLPPGIRQFVLESVPILSDFFRRAGTSEVLVMATVFFSFLVSIAGFFVAVSYTRPPIRHQAPPSPPQRFFDGVDGAESAWTETVQNGRFKPGSVPSGPEPEPGPGPVNNRTTQNGLFRFTSLTTSPFDNRTTQNGPVLFTPPTTLPFDSDPGAKEMFKAAFATTWNLIGVPIKFAYQFSAAFSPSQPLPETGEPGFPDMESIQKMISTPWEALNVSEPTRDTPLPDFIAICESVGKQTANFTDVGKDLVTRSLNLIEVDNCYQLKATDSIQERLACTSMARSIYTSFMLSNEYNLAGNPLRHAFNRIEYLKAAVEFVNNKEARTALGTTKPDFTNTKAATAWLSDAHAASESVPLELRQSAFRELGIPSTQTSAYLTNYANDVKDGVYATTRSEEKAELETASDQSAVFRAQLDQRKQLKADHDRAIEERTEKQMYPYGRLPSLSNRTELAAFVSQIEFIDGTFPEVDQAVMNKIKPYESSMNLYPVDPSWASIVNNFKFNTRVLCSDFMINAVAGQDASPDRIRDACYFLATTPKKENVVKVIQDPSNLPERGGAVFKSDGIDYEMAPTANLAAQWFGPVVTARESLTGTQNILGYTRAIEVLNSFAPGALRGDANAFETALFDSRLAEYIIASIGGNSMLLETYGNARRFSGARRMIWNRLADYYNDTTLETVGQFFNTVWNNGSLPFNEMVTELEESVDSAEDEQTLRSESVFQDNLVV